MPCADAESCADFAIFMLLFWCCNSVCHKIGPVHKIYKITAVRMSPQNSSQFLAASMFRAKPSARGGEFQVLNLLTHQLNAGFFCQNQEIVIPPTL